MLIFLGRSIAFIRVAKALKKKKKFLGVNPAFIKIFTPPSSYLTAHLLSHPFSLNLKQDSGWDPAAETIRRLHAAQNRKSNAHRAGRPGFGKYTPKPQGKQ